MLPYLIEPWTHQKHAVEFSLTVRDLALFFEMGTGKTATIINILRAHYMKAGKFRRTLIFAPPIVLHNWKREFAMHSKIPESKILVLEGSGVKRLKHFEQSKAPIVITNYESVQMTPLYQALLRWGPELRVADESHRLKNHKSKRANRVCLLFDAPGHNYLLTGTPILNSAMDIFFQFRILDGGETFGDNFWVFRPKYFEDANARWAGKKDYYPKFIPRPGALEAINKAIKVKSLRVLKKDCLDLPPFIRKRIEVPLSVEQKKIYKSMVQDYLAFVNDAFGKPRPVVAQMALTKALRLQQIVSGYVKTDDDGSEIALKDIPRLQILKELLEELTPDHKVIVWCNFKNNYLQISRLCQDLKLGHAFLTGDTKDKQAQVDEFNNTQVCRVMIANPAAGGVGTNLTASDYSIVYSRGFSWGDDSQAEARNYRGGSEIHEKVTRIDLVAPGTIDEHVAKALEFKQEISDQILDWNL